MRKLKIMWYSVQRTLWDGVTHILESISIGMDSVSERIYDLSKKADEFSDRMAYMEYVYINNPDEELR